VRPNAYTALLAIIAIGCFGGSREFPQLMPPPESPPAAYLLLGNSSGPDRVAQQGIIPAYDWFVEGKVDSFKIDPPLQWPSPLAVSERDTLVVRIETSAAPATIQVYQFSSLGPDGFAEGAPVPVTSWENPRLFSHAREHGYDRALVHRKEQERGGWEMAVPLPPSAGASFIVVWATWIDADDLSNGPYNSNWLFSVQKHGASRSR
jgi:hypothetical protein